MSQLADHLTKESVTRLHNEFTAGLEILQGHARKYPGFNRGTFEVVGEPLVRWVHHLLLGSAVYVGTKSPSAEHPFLAQVSISSILKDEMEKTGSKTPVFSLVADVSRILKGNGLTFMHKHAQIYIKPWDVMDLKYVPSHPLKLDPKVEKRIEEESDKPINSRIDLRTFKAPEATPESVMEFIGRFVPAAIKVQDSELAARQRILELEVELADAKEALATVEAKVEANAWDGVKNELNGLLSKD